MEAQGGAEPLPSPGQSLPPTPTPGSGPPLGICLVRIYARRAGFCPSPSCVVFGRLLNLSDPHLDMKHILQLLSISCLTSPARDIKGGNVRGQVGRVGEHCD